MSTFEVLDVDDAWHEPATDHPHWTETSYWGFYVPERGLSGTIYNMWRRNLGLVASRIWIWDDSGDTPVHALYSSMAEHVVIPDDADPTHFELPTGLVCERIAPLQSHRFRYTDPGAVEFDLTTRGIQPPTAAFHRSAPGTGHFDQHIRVQGTLSIWGERLQVDCLSMRDRTWGERSDYMGAKLNMLAGYMHGASDDANCWLVMASGTPDRPGEQPIPAGSGALVRDGESSPIAGGVRRVPSRSLGRPDRIELEFTDELGREHAVHGESLNHLGTMLNPSIFNWWSLYRWTDAAGTVAFGESQETWIPLARWQQMRAAQRKGR